MKIKVGGRYVARNGTIVEITGMSGRVTWPFNGSNGFTYTKKGCVVDGVESTADLMHEFKDEGSPSQLSTILTSLFWFAVIIGAIGFWGMAVVKLWQMMPGN